MSRSADSSYKGYTFQRARLLNLIVCTYFDDDTAKFYEEQLEDIDIHTTITGGEKVILYQEKYLNTSSNESLTKSSGLTKVIVSHFENNDITQINYDVMSTTGNINISHTLKSLLRMIKHKNPLIGKFICMNYLTDTKSFPRTYEKIIEYVEKYESRKITEAIEKLDKSLSNELEKNKNGEKAIEESEKILTNKETLIRIVKFCEFCNDPNNNELLLNYLGKLNVIITKGTFNDVHNKTLDIIKTKLPELNDVFNYMKHEYNDMYSNVVYGMFEMMSIKNLFDCKKSPLTMKTLKERIVETLNSVYSEENISDLVVYTLRHVRAHNDIQNS
jgi:hypothetical protein